MPNCDHEDLKSNKSIDEPAPRPALPRIIWQGVGVDTAGHPHEDYRIRVVETATDKPLTLETSSGRDAMGAPQWEPCLIAEANWLLPALIKAIGRRA